MATLDISRGGWSNVGEAEFASLESRHHVAATAANSVNLLNLQKMRKRSFVPELPRWAGTTDIYFKGNEAYKLDRLLNKAAIPAKKGKEASLFHKIWSWLGVMGKGFAEFIKRWRMPLKLNPDVETSSRKVLKHLPSNDLLIMDLGVRDSSSDSLSSLVYPEEDLEQITLMKQ